MDYYFEAFKKYVEFTGRSTRKPYWMFVLINFIISIIVSILGDALGLYYGESGNILSSLYALATFLPSLAFAIRRLHDADYKGWWVLFPIVNIVLLAQKGTQGPNRFGPALASSNTSTPTSTQAPTDVNTPPVA